MKALFIILMSTLFFTGCTHHLATAKLRHGCAELAEKAKPFKNLVFIFTKDSKNKIMGLGSGFVASKSGLIVSSAHIALKNPKTGQPHPKGLFVKFKENGKYITKEASILTTNAMNDSAILQVRHSFSSAEKISKKKPTHGCCVYAAGFNLLNQKPAKVFGNFFGYFPLNLIKAWGVKLRVQILTAHMIDGMSGGPVFNSDNEVIGIYSFALNFKKADGTWSRFSAATPVIGIINKNKK